MAEKFDMIARVEDGADPFNSALLQPQRTAT